MADQSLLNAQQASSANAIRSELARQSPELDALNQQYNLWSKVKDVADASTDRKMGQKSLFRAMLLLWPATLRRWHKGAGQCKGRSWPRSWKCVR
jgi:hypothetical protein